jgi:superoxide reductase
MIMVEVCIIDTCRMRKMAKEGATYVCDICQQIVVVKKSGAGTLVCCGEPMRLYEGD